MSAYSKIFIASKPVLVPGTSIDTTKDHLYLIYDLNGMGIMVEINLSSAAAQKAKMAAQY